MTDYTSGHQRVVAARVENIIDRIQDVHLNAAQVSIAEKAYKHRRDSYSRLAI